MSRNDYTFFMRHAIGECELDVDARQLYRYGAPVHLSPKAFDLLSFLASQRPRAVAKQELYDHLWPDTFVVEANLPILVREVRLALDDPKGTWIRTVHRHGYACAPESAVTPRSTAAASSHILFCGDREYPLVPGENVIGRDPASRVRFNSGSVSRRHASITIDGERATLSDFASKNGTFVDGEAVVNPRLLRDGAALRFGTIEMIYRWSPGQVPTDTIA
jgi:DNA-binding winged helix-turn-helix (wHTH) protein